MRLVEILLYPVRILAYVLIWLYRIVLSPIKGGHCVYYPTCSQYMLISIREWGLVRGLWLGIKRVFRCSPKHYGGIDYVPLCATGSARYLI